MRMPNENSRFGDESASGLALSVKSLSSRVRRPQGVRVARIDG
jgi:hypothetical protein